MFDDDAVKKPRGHEVGMLIDTMSVEELEERIGLLKAEIGRVATSGRNADQHFAGARLRHRQAHRLQYLGATKLGDGNRGHFGGDRHEHS